jgi:uncharacterized membrane protein
MKMKKWFIIAALIGLLLSVLFLVVSCSFLDFLGDMAGCRSLC